MNFENETRRALTKQVKAMILAAVIIVVIVVVGLVIGIVNGMSGDSPTREQHDSRALPHGGLGDRPASA